MPTPQSNNSRIVTAALASCFALAVLTAAVTTGQAKETAAAGKQVDSIVALVNDEPITGFELQQRSMMLAGGDVQQKAQEIFKASIKNPRTTERLKAILGKVIKANQGKSRDEIIAIFEKHKKDFAVQLQKEAVDRAKASTAPGVKKKALDELIDEKLKLQEAKRQGVTADDAEVDSVLTNIAKRNSMTLDQFKKRLGPGLSAMRNRIRSSLSWTAVVRRRYGAQISIATRDVDRLVAKSTSDGKDDVELTLQRILITMPVKIEQYGVAQRMQDAEKMRANFKGCKSTESIVKGVTGARFEELGKRPPSAFQEPTRTMLESAQDGEILPPTMGKSGIELLIVCSRNVVSANEEMRNKAELELKNREFDLLAQRHLKNLRQDAHIEYR